MECGYPPRHGGAGIGSNDPGRQEEQLMQLYKAKAVITPQKPIRLAGFGHRIGNFTDVRQDIQARCLILEDNSGNRTAILSVEMLCVTEEMTNCVREYLSGRYGIRPENVLLSATHNHSAPYLVRNAHPLLGEFNEEYASFLKVTIQNMIDQAMKTAIPVSCSYQSTKVYLSVNRRLKVDGIVEMRPNFQGPADPDCHLLRFHHEATGALEAVLLNYACHANITDINQVNADYPGVLCGLIEAEHPGSAALFLQGYTGDIRPRAVIGDEFFRGGFEMAERFGQSFYRTIRPALGTAGETLRLDLKGAIIRREITTVNQIADDLSTGKDLSVEPYTSWHRLFADRPERLYEPRILQVQALRITEKVFLIAVNGEVVGDYARDIRAAFPDCRILAAGYSNTLLGYLATAQQLQEGGYESEGFLYYFGLPGKWDASLDKTLRDSQKAAILAVK